MKTFFGARAIKIHLIAWVLAVALFSLLLIEPRGWDWVSFAVGVSVLLVVVTGLFAVPVALIHAVESFRVRQYWPAIAFSLIAVAALLAVSAWRYFSQNLRH